MYTLTIASADPKSISAKPPVEFTKSVTKWSLSLSLSLTHTHTHTHCLAEHTDCCRFTKDGVLVEGLFWKDVDGLVNDYTKESKKSK